MDNQIKKQLDDSIDGLVNVFEQICDIRKNLKDIKEDFMLAFVNLGEEEKKGAEGNELREIIDTIDDVLDDLKIAKKMVDEGSDGLIEINILRG